MKTILAALALASAAGPALAQTPASAPTPGPAYVLPETETFELKGADGYPYQIFISMPKGEAPAQGYPILYVLDGNALFGGFAEGRRLLGVAGADASKAIVVGIGYKTDKAYDARRVTDFMQDFKKPNPPTQTVYERFKPGGREQFAKFILETLKPELARRYKINPHRQALFGHSFGGAFALYMMFNHPTALHAIVAASPSIWWNDQAVLAEERAFAEKLRAGKIDGPVSRLRLVSGDRDEMPVENEDAMVMAKRLEALSGYGLRVEAELFRSEIHVAVPPRSVTSTLRFATTWP